MQRQYEQDKKREDRNDGRRKSEQEREKIA